MDIPARAAELIAQLGLLPHPEGGYYRQVFKSGLAVQAADARSSRSALTTIYFLLPGSDISRWHLVTSDEVWHHYEGAPLELFTADASFSTTAHHVLGPVADTTAPVHVVDAHRWQAARSTGAFTLVGCTVAPGFEFADFTMLCDVPALADRVRQQHPALAFLI